MDRGCRPCSPEELTQAVHDNLRNLGLDVLDVVNLRSMHGMHGARRGVDRGAAHRPGRPSAEGPGASYRAEQCHGRAGRGSTPDRPDRLRAEQLQPGPPTRRRADRRPGERRASRTCRSSRSAGSRRSSRPPCRTSRAGSVHADAGRAGVAAAPLAQHPVDPRHVVGRPSAREPGRRAVDAVTTDPGGVGRDRRLPWRRNIE